MEKFWLLVVCLGLVEGSTIPRYQQHGHYQPYQYVDNQLDNRFDVQRMSDLVRILERRTDSLHRLPELVSVLEESTRSLVRMPDLGKSLERISDLERVFKDMSDSLKYRDVQESIESLQLKVQNLQSKFQILEQKLENLQFSSRGASVCTGETVDTPEAWTEALNNVMNGIDRDVCADADLLIRVVQSDKVSPPDGISQFGNYWSWVSGSDSLNKYFQVAKDIVAQGGSDEAKREKLLVYIQTWVGFDNPAYDDDYKYYLYVISKSASNAVSDYDYPIFSPTWDNLFDKLSSFTLCKFTGNIEACERGKIEISFDKDVQDKLKAQTATQITGCKKGFWTCGEGDRGGCSRDFCNMRNILIAERNKGGQAAVFKYYMKNQDGKSADEARAFFDIGVGATFLFTGDGSTFNGILKQKTGAEFISRGDIPIAVENPKGSRFQILPVP